MANTRLILTDTDSVAYEIKSERNPYKVLHQGAQSIMDFSNFDLASEYYSEQNKLCPGKVEDDFGWRIIDKIVALRAKMYSTQWDLSSGERAQKSTAKGVKRYLQRKHLHHAVYRDCLFNNEESAELNFFSIRGKRGRLYTLPETKRGLNTFNDKRHNVVDYHENRRTFTSFAFGHKALVAKTDERGSQLWNRRLSLILITTTSTINTMIAF